MTRRIQVLPDAVANQIAAGEAVERPASVAKELVENAIDAGASRIVVAVERGGKRRMRVTDDGVGMGREDALLCLDRHATSKITRAQDLDAVRTLGFRGEALPSIAAVSRMTLETNDGQDDVGTRVTVDGGRICIVEDHARQRGTTVEVASLFFNAPVRGRFLKAVSAETRAVSETVAGLGLVNPSISFVLESDGRTLLDLSAAADAAERVGQLWGAEQAGTLVAAAASDDGLEVRGLVQRPDAARPGLRRSYLFVNGRPFRESALVRAAERGYLTTVPRDVRPWMLLYLRVPAGEVDVNVHPAKAEVRFRDRARVEDVVERAVRAALGGEGSAATFSEPSGAPHLTALAGPAADARLVVREGRGSAAASSAADTQMALFMTGAEAEPDSTSEAFPELAAAMGRPRLWQALDTYVLAETRDGLLIVDQHSAHERILYERLMAAFERGGQDGQRLLFPLTLGLTPAEVDCLRDLGGLFGRTGFEVEEFGGDTVIVRAVPNPHPYFDAERAFREMVHELTHGSELVRSARNQHERIAMTFACKGAVKAGQRLTDPEMQQLFDELFATELPHHDVHGRPTIVRLGSAELARRFGRS